MNSAGVYVLGHLGKEIRTSGENVREQADTYSED